MANLFKIQVNAGLKELNAGKVVSHKDVERRMRCKFAPNIKNQEVWAVEAEKRLKVYKERKLKTISFEDMFV